MPRTPASPRPPGHEVIIANAGCGKTEALAMRFLHLMRAGADPERIIALTFTRAAAGEFFERIVQLLAKASKGGAGLERLREALEEPDLQQPDCLRLLRSVLRSMPRLMLTTLDSFCFRIVQAHPFELGLGAPPEMIDSALAEQERQRVILAALDDPRQEAEARDRFLRAIDLASFGRDERSVVRFVMELVSEGHQLWLEAPDEQLWDPASQLWDGKCPWLSPAGFSPEKAIEQLERALDQKIIPDKSKPRLQRFITDLRQHIPGATFTKDIDFVVQKLLDKWTDVGSQSLEVTIDRHAVSIDPALGQILRDITIWLLAPEWRRRLESTVGIGRVIAAYEAHYDRLLRTRGRLTFADVLALLSSADSPTLGQTNDSEARLRIDYRLDARFDHWMLDEFQDTSLVQWHALKNLVGEIVQDPSDQRTLFYVGDLKQSIYSWRGAAPQLFHAIREHYNQGQGERLPLATLPESYRYRPAISSMINEVFGPGSALHDLFGSTVSNTWSQSWVEHRSAPSLSDAVGHAALLQPSGDPDEKDQERRWQVVLDILRHIRPHETGRSCAIIVRKNDDVRALSQWLRRQSRGQMPVTAVGRDSVATDNEIGRVLMQLLTLAVNPRDTYAWERLRMCHPIAAGVGLAELTRSESTAPSGWTPGRLASFVWSQVQRLGFEECLRHWLDLLIPAEPDSSSDFNRRRGLAVVELGRRFDRTGSRSIPDFLGYARAANTPAESVPGGIQVMTIHASKGLGFDLVILPELQGSGLNTPRSGQTLSASRQADFSINWIFAGANNSLRQMEPRLENQHQETIQRDCIENLCLLYVAMTRAKNALYLVIDGKADSTSRNHPKLLRQSLEADDEEEEDELVFDGNQVRCLWQQGSLDWHHELPGKPAPKDTQDTPPLPSIDRTRAATALRLPRRAPSAHSTAGGGFLHRPGDLANNIARRSLGNEVHQALEQVRWVGPKDQGTLTEHLKEWRQTLAPEALGMVESTLANPATRPLFEPLDPASELWREQAFEVVIDGEWISGVFDRVEVAPDRIRLIDFKTSERRADGKWPIDRHRDQLHLYRRVLAKLIDRSVEQIEPIVLYVTGPEAIPVEQVHEDRTNSPTAS